MSKKKSKLEKDFEEICAQMKIEERIRKEELAKPRPVTRKLLDQMKEGDPILNYGPFVNITFVKHEKGHVTMRDHAGGEKSVYEHLFIKHANLPPLGNNK